MSPLVVVGKANGDPRLCLDLRRVNEAVVRERFPMPIVDELLARIGKGTVRTRLDIRDAFLQTELAPDSRDVTTFITNKGLFRFKRLPFGLVSAPECFQRVMDEILSGCEGMVCYLDDIYVEGRNKEEHDARLQKVFDRLNLRGVILNQEKCIIGVPELEFLGHVISSNGIRPASSKVEALISFRRPENVAEVKSFLGLANYLNKFIPNLATLDEPLRRILRHSTKFVWSEEQQTAFDTIKKALSDTDNLGYFSVDDATSVIADASPTALGAVLVQKNARGEYRVISFASKSLTDMERRYCQTEKEALALVWSVEKFQMYLLGKQFDLLTDCKALTYLFTPRSKPCARMERWILRLQGFQYMVKHIPGEQNIADVLSRLSTLHAEPFDIAEELFVNEVAKVAAASTAIRWEELERFSKDDEDTLKVMEALSKDRLHEMPVAYRVIGRELCSVGNVLMRGDRVVIPQLLRQQVLSIAHEGHPGSRMMKNHLRAAVWWPKMDQYTETFVARCRGCTLVSAPGAPEPMSRREMPARPWEDLAIDFLGPLPEGQYLFVVIDYYSRYFEICEMNTITAEDTIRELTTIFSRFGVPVTLTADNAPQLSEDCTEFSNFCNSFGIKLINTVPYWPQMNGEVERQNRTILKRLQIAQVLGQDWRAELQRFLLTYRAAVHSTTGRSPAELLFGRRIRTKLPQIELYRAGDEDVRDRDAVQKEKGREYSDKRRRAQESGISVGDRVLTKRMKKDNKLSSEYINEDFVVTSKLGADVTIKSTVTGKEFRRNTAHLKKIIDDSSDRSTTTSEVQDACQGKTNITPESGQQHNIQASDNGSDNGNSSTTGICKPANHGSGRKRQEPSWFRNYVPY